MSPDFAQKRQQENCVTSATTTGDIYARAATAYSHPSMLTSAPPLHLAVAAAATTTGPSAVYTSTSTSRPTLPPLSRIQALTAPGTPAQIPSPPLRSQGESGYLSHAPPRTVHRYSTEPTGHDLGPLQSGVIPARDPDSSSSSSAARRFHNPLERGLDPLADRLAYAPAATIDHDDRRPRPGSYPTYGQPSSGRPSNATTSRCVLHVRQQPRAARAGPDGKDRRPIDPPPVVQLLMTDFDPDNAADVEELQNSYYVVHCRLVSANSPRRDVSTLASTTESGCREVQRLLLGSAVASPHHTKDDPNPATMPAHPQSAAPKTPSPTTPPSPTTRFITTAAAAGAGAATAAAATGKARPGRPVSAMPGTFFIFADLSVRRAGAYRLEFRLMKVEADKLVPGACMPVLDAVASRVFRVVNAKDFDQVQPSTRLVRGLIERGAGFPLKLKKGTRDGQRRRPQREHEHEHEHERDHEDLPRETAGSREASDVDDEE